MKSRVGLRELVARGADVVKGDVHWSDEHRAYLKAKLKCEDSVETIETERSVEPHHTDPLELDNLDGTSPLKHTVTISQEWTQSVELDTEQAKVENTTSGAELPGVGTFGRKAETAVKSTYSVTEGTKKVLTREFSFEAPPSTKRVVSFTYAQVWQHGLARVADPHGAVAEIPFKVAVDMTVNVAQHDTTA